MRYIPKHFQKQFGFAKISACGSRFVTVPSGFAQPALYRKEAVTPFVICGC